MSAHADRHLAGGADALAGNLDANARVQVKANSIPVGIRRSINFIAGENVLLEVVENQEAETINITISFPNQPFEGDEDKAATKSGVAGETLAAYDLCYLKSDGKYWKAQADAEATMPGVVLAPSALNADDTADFIRRGEVTIAGWSWATVGGFVYASAAIPGGLTQTLPSGSGEQLQIVGVALSATKIDFDPQLVLVE